MKTLFTTLTFSLALCSAVGATAQSRSAAPVAAVDTVMLSETTDGDYLIHKYVVNRSADSDYSIRYQISMAKLMPALDGNKQELADLDGFIGNLMKDTLMNVRWVEVTGYASPDGPMQLNETLAKHRTADFMAYADKKYNFSQHFKVKTASMVDNWMAARIMIAQSAIPNKAEVLKVIDGTANHMEKEAQLKRMPGVWNYLKTNILPPMRRVEVMINYGAGTVVERRTLIPKPAPEPEACCEVVDETITGIIVEMPDPGVDFKQMTRQERKEFRAMEKAAKKEAKVAEKFAKKEAKEVKKMMKTAAKAAN